MFTVMDPSTASSDAAHPTGNKLRTCETTSGPPPGTREIFRPRCRAVLIPCNCGRSPAADGDPRLRRLLPLLPTHGHRRRQLPRVAVPRSLIDATYSDSLSRG